VDYPDVFAFHLNRNLNCEWTLFVFSSSNVELPHQICELPVQLILADYRTNEERPTGIPYVSSHTDVQSYQPLVGGVQVGFLNVNLLRFPHTLSFRYRLHL